MSHSPATVISHSLIAVGRDVVQALIINATSDLGIASESVEVGGKVH